MAARVLAAGAAAGLGIEGVAAALVETDGIDLLALGESRTRAWLPEERAALAVAGPGRDEAVETALGGMLDGLPGWVLAGILPPPGIAVSGEMLALGLGREVAWDFAAANLGLGGMAGGEDAFFHHALLRHLGVEGPAAVLDLGPVARLTWADARIADPAAPGACLAFDAGPGTGEEDGVAPTDAHALKEGAPEGGRDGATIEGAVAEMLARPFFSRPPPRRWGGGALPPEPVAGASAPATRAALVAAAVVQGLSICPAPPRLVIVCGPGRHDAAICSRIAAGAGGRVAAAEEMGLPGGAMRAQAAAFLAVRAVRGLSCFAPGTTGVAAAVGGARLSRPERAAG